MKVTRIIAAAAMSAVLAGTAQAQVTQNCTGTTTTGPTGCQVVNTVSASVPIVARLVLSSATTTLTAPTAGVHIEFSVWTAGSAAWFACATK